MKKLACVTAALVALFAIGAESPANAAMGQCFDAYGRPVGPPHNTDNPPYSLICSVFAQGGQCSGVDPAWAANNCGLGPRYAPGYYDKGYPQYYYEKPDHSPRYYNRKMAPQERDRQRLERANPGQKYVPHSDPNHPLIPQAPQNNAR